MQSIRLRTYSTWLSVILHHLFSSLETRTVSTWLGQKTISFINTTSGDKSHSARAKLTWNYIQTLSVQYTSNQPSFPQLIHYYLLFFQTRKKDSNSHTRKNHVLTPSFLPPAFACARYLLKTILILKINESSHRRQSVWYNEWAQNRMTWANLIKAC